MPCYCVRACVDQKLFWLCGVGGGRVGRRSGRVG